jgi:hypothetical protein
VTEDAALRQENVEHRLHRTTDAATSLCRFCDESQSSA